MRQRRTSRRRRRGSGGCSVSFDLPSIFHPLGLPRDFLNAAVRFDESYSGRHAVASPKETSKSGGRRGEPAPPPAQARGSTFAKTEAARVNPRRLGCVERLLLQPETTATARGTPT